MSYNEKAYVLSGSTLLSPFFTKAARDACKPQKDKRFNLGEILDRYVFDVISMPWTEVSVQEYPSTQLSEIPQKDKEYFYRGLKNQLLCMYYRMYVGKNK